MLIRRLACRNFMKFRDLELSDIPPAGVIGIEGRNEGGKSTIGELVQFALFGKTLGSRSSSLSELIHWDEDECSVELDFDVATGTRSGEYRVTRQLDRYGTNFARVLDRRTGAELASGLIKVRTEMTRLARFEFEDFTKSFFLSERETPRSPSEMRTFLDRMFGIDVLVGATDDVRSQISEHESDFAKVQGEVHRNEQQIGRYLPNVERIPELEETRKEYAQTIDDLQGKKRDLESDAKGIEQGLKSRDAQRSRLKQLPDKPASRLQEASRQLLENTPDAHKSKSVYGSSQKDLEKLRSRIAELEKVGRAEEAVAKSVAARVSDLEKALANSGEHSLAERARHAESEVDAATHRKRRFSKVGLLFLLVALGTGVAGGLAFAEITSMQREVAFGLLGGAGVALVLMIVGFAKASGARRNLEALTRTASEARRKAELAKEQLAELQKIGVDSLTPQELAPALASVRAKEVKAAVETFASVLAEVCGEKREFSDLTDDLAKTEGRIAQRLRDAKGDVDKNLGSVEKDLEREKNRATKIDNEIREYEKQRGRMESFEEKNDELKRDAAEVRTEIEHRRLAIELLEETVESLRHRAGPSLGRSLRKLLPHVTGGRYRDLKITPGFDLQVFTTDKSDFLAPHELSGGTFEGLSLGFRLAFSQAFIRTVVQNPQFLFLDEPFKAMDTERVSNTLSALVRLSDELRQVFVLIPGIDAAYRDRFDRVFSVEVGQDSLHLSGGDRGGTALPSRRMDAPPTADGASSEPHSRLPLSDAPPIEERSYEEPSGPTTGY